MNINDHENEAPRDLNDQNKGYETTKCDEALRLNMEANRLTVEANRLNVEVNKLNL
jgi:hypothetical protein